MSTPFRPRWVTTLALSLWLALGSGPLTACRQGDKAARNTPSSATTTRDSTLAQPVTGATPSSAAPSPGDPEERLVAERLQFVTLTTQGKKDDESLPWVIALHGLGDTPEGFVRLFDGVSFAAHVYAVRAPIPYGAGYDWYGVRVSGDPKRLSQAMSRAADRVATLIDDLKQQPFNRGKPVVTGFSQGGMLSYALALSHPDKLALAAPVGGWLPPPLWPKHAAAANGVSIAAFHGEMDRAVPFDQSRMAAEHLTSLGYELTFQSYPGLGHSMNRELIRDWDAAVRAALER